MASTYPSPQLEVARDLSASSYALEEWACGILDAGTPSVQLAVFRDGCRQVSLAAGYSPSGQRAVSRSSLYCLYSSSKLISALALYALHDRGYFEWDDPIEKHWPAFGGNGKQQVTIRHMISHRAGLAKEPSGTSWPLWRSRQETARWLERQTLKWPAGSDVGYHNRTWGFVLDHLVWLWTGLTTGEFLRRDLLDPVGVDHLYYGISREQYERAFVKTEMIGEPGEPPEPARLEFRPRIGGEENMFNSFELMSLGLTWGSVVGTAEAAAEIAQVLAGGGLLRAVRLFSESTFNDLRELQGPGGEIDKTLAGPARWGLGVQLDLFPDIPELKGTLGHSGGSTVHLWVRPELRLTACCILGARSAVGRGPVPGMAIGTEQQRKNVAEYRAARANWQEGFARAVMRDFLSAHPAAVS